jgi:hypothetical protein
MSSPNFELNKTDDPGKRRPPQGNPDDEEGGENDFSEDYLNDEDDFDGTDKDFGDERDDGTED